MQHCITRAWDRSVGFFPRGGVFPRMDYMGRLHLKGVPHKDGVEVYKREGNELSFRYLKGRFQISPTDPMKNDHCFYYRYTKGLPFLTKNGISKGKGLDLGAEPPYIKLS